MSNGPSVGPYGPNIASMGPYSMQSLQFGPAGNPNAQEIEMKYSAQEEMIRKQYEDQRQQLKAQSKMSLDRYMRARSECAAGNTSSCQMVPGLKTELGRYEQDNERLTKEEQDMISELNRQKESEMNANKPRVIYNMGNVGMSTPGQF